LWNGKERLGRKMVEARSKILSFYVLAKQKRKYAVVDGIPNVLIDDKRKQSRAGLRMVELGFCTFQVNLKKQFRKLRR
jgi:hypothetical protein